MSTEKKDFCLDGVGTPLPSQHPEAGVRYGLSTSPEDMTGMADSFDASTGVNHDSRGPLPSAQEVLDETYRPYAVPVSALREPGEPIARAPHPKRRTVWAVATLLGAGFVAGVGPAHDENSDNFGVTAPTPTQSQASVPNVAPVPVDWTKGKAIVHFVSLDEAQPFTKKQQNEVVESVKGGIDMVHSISGGKYPSMPVEMSKGKDLRKEGVTLDDFCDPEVRDATIAKIQREVVSEGSSNDLHVSVLNVDGVWTCENGGTMPRAQAHSDRQFIHVTAGSELLLDAGPKLIAHKILHMGYDTKSGYGHDSALGGRGEDTGRIVAAMCNRVSNYAFSGTLPGSGHSQTGYDPDPINGFLRRMLGTLDENQVKIVTNDTTVELRALSGDNEGTKLIRIPVEGLATLPNNVTDKPLDSAEPHVAKPAALYIELSHPQLTDGDKVTNQEVKAYLVDEEARQPSSFLLPIGSNKYDHGIFAKDTGKVYTLELGDKTIDLRVDSIKIPSKGNDAAAAVNIDFQ